MQTKSLARLEQNSLTTLRQMKQKVDYLKK